MIKRYIRSQINRYGVEGFMMKVLEMVAKLTKSKKDDKVVADLKVALSAVKSSKKK
mgnify:CR=1 FL=1